MKLRNMTSVYFTGEQGILCLYRIGSRVAGNKYVGAAGGHFEPDELNDPKACVLREMREELGLTEEDAENLTLRYVTLRHMEGEIRQNYYYFARLKTDCPLASTEGALRWVLPEEVLNLPMPVTARDMLLHYLREGQYTADLYGGVTQEQGTTFLAMET